MGTKVLIIGLDGATPELLERWVAEDRLPNLKKIMQKGVYGKLRSVYPPISPAAWTTFATGYNPGKHGVYDFRDYDNTRYSCFADTIVDSNSFAGKTIWDLTGAAGQKVGVVTVPVTYPAWRVNGFMISGYPTPDTGKNYTYPPELGKTIPPMVGDAAFFKSATHHVLLKKMNRLMHVSTDTSIAQMKKDDYGLFIMVVGATDRAHHDWWKYIDPEHPAYDSQEAKLYGNLILEVYRAADDCVGKFLEAIDDDTTVIVMSDHGGGAHPKYYFNTNCLLRTCDPLKASAKANRAKGGPKGAFKQFYRTKIRRFPYLQPNRLFSIGTMFWLPSSEGVSWWLRNGYELLRARYPDLTYDIVGARPPHNLQALAAEHEGVTVHGYVADTLPFWTSATALAVPILSGGGVRVKILEAMAMGVPLVSTTVGCEGLNVRHGEHLLVADTPEAFAHAIARIFQDTARASQLARNARQFVLEHYDAKVALRTPDAAYEQARGLSERKPGKEYRP